MTRERKIHMLAIIAVVAVFAVAASPIATVYAQEPESSGEYDGTEEKKYGDKDRKSCAGKEKRGMNA